MNLGEELILRSLDDGWDYQPDWRNRVVENYVERCTLGNNPANPITLLDAEKDPFVRQAFRCRMGLRAVHQKAISFAYRTHQQNKTTGLASMIKAMVIADRRVEEIAAELHVARESVVAFTRLFFDVERYLGVEVWLQSIVMPSEAEGRKDVESVRERRWLAIALYDGWPGLEAALFNRTPTTPQGIQKTRLAIQAALSSRALEYARTIQASGIAPTHEDLSRYAMVADANSQKAEDKGVDATKFAKALFGVLEKEAQESDDPKLAAFRTEPTGIKSGCIEVPRYRKRA
ncbi:MAG: hypothetical protein WCO68_05850 [Verrucomicrobiota bacterium]